MNVPSKGSSHKEMGKNLRHQEPRIFLENHTHSPRCMWGILHRIPHNRWHYVKKRLPRRRHGSGKSSTDQDSVRSSSLEQSEMLENIDSPVGSSAVETKSIVPVPAHKSSMKSRIKALITEEMSKRRGRHHRSSSYPTRTQLDGTSIIPRIESSETESPAEKNDVLGRQDRPHSTALLDPVLPLAGNDSSCVLCAAMLNMNYLKQSEVSMLGRQPVRDHTVLQDKLIYAIEPSKRASLQESKLFMDALDLLNMRKEVFLKILRDPSSSLAHHLHCRRLPNLRLGLTKSVSFPAPASSDRRGFKTQNSMIRHESGGCTQEEDEVKGSFIGNTSPDNACPTSSAKVLKKRHDSKLALKHFKNLREKIKHVIRDRKKEKNRIIMDAVHHKIPYGQSVSKDSNNDPHMTLEIKAEKFSKSPLQHFKRTSSFDESFDRYNRLLEIGVNRESKDHVSERLMFKTADTLSAIPTKSATLARMFSLPDLRSYSSIQIDDSASTSCSPKPDMTAARNISVESTIPTEQKPLCLDSDSKVEESAVSRSGSQQNLSNVGDTIDDSSDLKTCESGFSHDFNLEPEPMSTPKTSKSDHFSENDYIYQEDEIGEIGQVPEASVSEGKIVDIDIMESQLKQFYDNFLRYPVDSKNEAEFNYVKDVLELSGFSRDEILGKWHSAEHPVDPLVFEEVPEFSGNEDGENYDHLLLFDLINEVLLDIYERSFCYWPTPLTERSRIHQMPKGHHVLEKVWAEISWLLSWRPEMDQAIDDSVSRDLAKNDCWMNLQLDAECVGLEVEDLIFDDLLEDIIST